MCSRAAALSDLCCHRGKLWSPLAALPKACCKSDPHDEASQQRALREALLAGPPRRQEPTTGAQGPPLPGAHRAQEGPSFFWGLGKILVKPSPGRVSAEIGTPKGLLGTIQTIHLARNLGKPPGEPILPQNHVFSPPPPFLTQKKEPTWLQVGTRSRTQKLTSPFGGSSRHTFPPASSSRPSGTAFLHFFALLGPRFRTRRVLRHLS